MQGAEPRFETALPSPPPQKKMQSQDSKLNPPAGYRAKIRNLVEEPELEPRFGIQSLIVAEARCKLSPPPRGAEPRFETEPPRGAEPRFETEPPRGAEPRFESELPKDAESRFESGS